MSQVYHINPDGSRTRIFESQYYTTGIEKGLRENIDDEIRRVKKGEASIIIVDGSIGSGKTNTAITLAKHIQANFDFDKQTGRGVEQFAKAWDYSQKAKAEVKACIFDEAHTYNRRGFASAINKAMNVFFNTFRDAKTILIFCLPHFSDLDSAIYNTGAVRGLVHMKEKHKNRADAIHIDGISIQNMLDFIDNSRKKRYAKRQCYNNVVHNYTSLRLSQDYLEIAKSSNIGKEELRRSSMASVSE